jgi:hypothetical protein
VALTVEAVAALRLRFFPSRTGTLLHPTVATETARAAKGAGEVTGTPPTTAKRTAKRAHAAALELFDEMSGGLGEAAAAELGHEYLKLAQLMVRAPR